ncbi:hypothetical protein [Mucilaginibacter jinjuensis]|uniref:Uncharacterized protein n=1 Tax=Mucilaginibacter jinjuensis TaxID=1176721 RepID=A0ABY7T828_9SPHI|nr:hypothetical protein [Mucilaginibacter jinjuensis]WCT12423.1 hypothetical protein PQO05_00570 [Mucilaginibacter jinjuensis]
MIFHHPQYEIEVINDENYVLNSKDNLNHYQHILHDPADVYQPSAKHGIRVKENGVETSSVIICASGGATGIFENSYLIKNGVIFICCTDHVYALQIPSLDLIWKNNLDWATCFCIYEFGDDLIVHGELVISRVTTDGIIKWQFSGRDIFVTPNNKTVPFKIVGNEIILTDWQDYQYRLNAEGQQLG